MIRKIEHIVQGDPGRKESINRKTNDQGFGDFGLCVSVRV